MLKARDLLQQTTEQLWDTLQPGIHDLMFDDGTIIPTRHKEILFSSYFWDIHRTYPNTPLLPKHSVKYILKDKPLNSSTHVKLFESIYWDVVEAYQLLTPLSRDRLTEMVYEITNNVYNDLSCRLSEYVTSIDILDFIEVLDHPPIQAANEGLQPTDESIRDCYDVILNELNNSPALAHNAVAVATRAKTVNAGQVMQCVGPRGKITEVDGQVMEVPILRSFVKGMRNLYNLVLESRTAAKSLYFSEAPLQDGEYFARRLQLITMAVEYIERPKLINGVLQPDSKHDCGSQDYLIWRIKGPDVVGDTTLYPGDLVFLAGKYYLDEETNTYKVLSSKDTHLINKTLKLRTVLGCHHPDPHGVCSVCFGQLSDNIADHANIGHLCAATVTQQTTQSILSTKHLISSATAGMIRLSEIASAFLKVGRKGESFYLLPNWKNKPIQMVVSSLEAYGLTDIMLVDSAQDINPSRVSAIEMIELIVGPEEKCVRHPISVMQEGRKSIFSSEFLQYLKIHGWKVDEAGNFVMSFEYWDFSKPIMLMPLKEYSFANHAREIAKIIESRIADISNREKPDSPKATLVELFELVNSKLNVNIACLEVIIYAMMCQNQPHNKFGLARNSDRAGLGVLDPIIHNRSLSSAYAYELQGPLMSNPRSFFNEGRGDNVLDVFIAPREVVEHYKNRKR